MSRPPSLSQQHYTHHQSFEITPDYFLNVHARSLTGQSHQRFDLFDLDHYPSVITSSSKPLLLATGLGILIILIGLGLSLIKGFGHYVEWLITVSSLTLACGVLFYLSHKTMLVYYHRQTHQAMVEILTLNQNKTQRNQFIKQLNALLLRLAEYDRSSFYAQQNSQLTTKDGVGYN